MTSYLLSGYLAVCNGRRVASENPNTHKTTNHMYYDTVIQTSGVDIPAEIRYWVPASATPVADGTIVDVLAKMQTPSNAKASLDVIQFAAFPGDPSSDAYEDGIPDRPFPTVFVLGHTSGASETMDDGISVGYEMQTSEYVRDQARTSRVYKPRWKKTPRPSQGSAVYIVGAAYGLHLAGGHLMVDVDQVQLNVGTTSASSSVPRVEAGGGPPAKRRRFPTSAPAGDSKTGTSSSAPTEDSKAGTNSPTQPAHDFNSVPQGNATPDSTESPVEGHHEVPKTRKAAGRRRIARIEEPEE